MARYTEADKTRIFTEVCEQVSKGKALRNVLKKANTVDYNTFYRWIDDDEAKREQYARAMEDRAANMFEDIADIADTSTPEDVQCARLKIDARKWLLSKMNPKKYGDKLDLNHSGQIKLGIEAKEEYEQ